MTDNIKSFYERYWRRFGIQKDLFYERDIVFPEIFHEGEKVLDLACGDGRSSQLIAKITKVPIYGLDISSRAVKQARKVGIIAFQGNVEEKFPFKSGQFDTVFWGDNIEHLLFPRLTIKEIHRVLKNKGRLVLSLPNMAYWRYRLYYLKNGCLPDTEFNNQLPWEWSHIRFFNLNILKKFLSENGFFISRYWGISRRKLDRLLVRLFPQLWGMILVVETWKRSK